MGPGIISDMIRRRRDPLVINPFTSLLVYYLETIECKGDKKEFHFPYKDMPILHSSTVMWVHVLHL